MKIETPTVEELNANIATHESDLAKQVSTIRKEHRDAGNRIIKAIRTRYGTLLKELRCMVRLQEAKAAIEPPEKEVQGAE